MKNFGCKDQQEVLDVILNPENQIKFVRIFFTDILGRNMDFAIPTKELESAFKEGKGFDGSSVEGFMRIEESDLIIKPDASSFRVLPWVYRGFDEKVSWREAVMFGDIFTPDGKLYEGDSRYILKKILAKGKNEFGIDEVKMGPELEFFIFPDKKTAVPLDEGGYFMGGLHGEIRKEIQLLLEKMGIDSEYDHHEVANGQHEIDLKYLNALEMADVCMLFRYIVKKVARMHDLYATFMPKPLNGQNGSGMHVHQSLWSNGRSLFFSRKEYYNISQKARQYIAGLMFHAEEITAVFCQWVNSFKRLIEGYEAPVYVAWGQRNRSAYIRIPKYQPGAEHATRIELRSPDPSCNLYLAFATMIAAGLKGIEKGYEVSAPVEENIYTMSLSRQKKLKIKTLPANLQEALNAMRKSDLLMETLGDHVFRKFMANKQYEIREYNKNVSKEFERKVSDYEIKKYLPVL